MFVPGDLPVTSLKDPKKKRYSEFSWANISWSHSLHGPYMNKMSKARASKYKILTSKAAYKRRPRISWPNLVVVHVFINLLGITKMKNLSPSGFLGNQLKKEKSSSVNVTHVIMFLDFHFKNIFGKTISFVDCFYF